MTDILEASVEKVLFAFDKSGTLYQIADCLGCNCDMAAYLGGYLENFGLLDHKWNLTGKAHDYIHWANMGWLVYNNNVFYY